MVAKGGWADVDGARLWYQDSGGSGVPIVLLHAATGSAASWPYQQERFGKEGYRVIAYSRRGHYRSAVAAPDKNVSGTADLLGLARHLELPPFHLVGTAAGGFTALDFGVSHPELVRSLVVASSLGGIDEAEFVAATSRLLTPEVMALPPHIRELGPAYRALNPNGTSRWMVLERMGAPNPTRLQPKENVLDWRTLRQLKPPALFLTGAADLLTPPALLALLRPHLPNSRYAIIAEAGHSAYWEQPGAFNAAVLSFIARH